MESRFNVIYLVKELNREESATHTVLVVASNSPNPINVLPANTLTITIIVSSHHIATGFNKPVLDIGTILKKVLAYPISG